MSDFDDEDDARHEEMLRKHRQRLQEAAKKYSVELDDRAESKPTPSKSNSKYDNPFERSGDDFDREMFDSTEDFITESLNPKAKVNIKHKPKVTEESKLRHSELASIYEDERSKESMELQKSHILIKSEYNDWQEPLKEVIPKPVNLSEEDDYIQKKINELLHGSISSNEDLDREYNHDNNPTAELSYQDILKKYKQLEDNPDENLHTRKPSSIEGFAEKEEYEKSIKLAEAEILKYKEKIEKSLKEDEESMAFRKSIESERFKYLLDGEGFNESGLHRYMVNPSTLEYSLSSRRESEIKGILETEHDEIYNINRNSPSLMDRRI